MARFKLIFASVLLVGIALWGWHWYKSPRHIRFEAGEREEEESEKGGGPFPSDWFMAQRTWPDSHIETADYLSAAQAAEQLHHQRATLDDPIWVPAGPNNIGARVSAVLGHPTNPNLYYVAAATGGIWKTTNGGTNWTPIFDDAPSMTMGDLTMDWEHPDTLYAATGEAHASGYSYFGSGVYRTTNGGVSWTNIGLENSRYISRIALDPQDNQSIWVAVAGEFYGPTSERGIYHSTNGGANWENVLYVDDTTGASDVVIHPTNSQIVYAAMWERMRTNENRLAGGRGSGIFRTTNGGANWERLTDGLPPQSDTVGRIGLAISQSNPNVLYAIYADHPGYYMGIYKTTDGGNTWSRTNDGAMQDIYSSYGWYFGNIRVRPDNPNVVFALGMEMGRTTDGGQNWDIIAYDVHVDHHAMWFYPGTPTTMLEGNDGGFYKSTNSGNTWTFITGLPINQFYAATVDFQHPQRRYGGTQDQGSMRTMTGGLNDWEQILGGDGFYCLVDPTNSNIIFAEYQYGGLTRSDNGGDYFVDAANGIDQSDRINWSMPIAFDPENPATLYTGTHRMYRTTDHGNNWTPISQDLTSGPGNGNLTFGTIATIGVSAADPRVIYAGTDDAHVWVSQNSGSNWTDISNGLPQRWVTRVTPDPVDSASVFVTVSGFRNLDQDAHIFYSTNYGQNWQSISGDLPSGPLNDVVRDPAIPGRLYVASDFGTFYTNDLGEHWLPLGTGMPRLPVIQLVLHPPTHQIVAATYGRSMFTLDLSQLATGEHPAPGVASKYLLVSNYPNPFNGMTTIDFEVPAPGHAELTVFDMMGRKVTTLLNGFQPAGRARVQWQAQNVATGTYFIKLTASGQTRITKALLLR